MRLNLAIAFLVVLGCGTVEAQRRAGGAVRVGARPTVNTNAARTSIRSNQDVNRNVNRNRDVDRNVNQNVDVHRNTNINANYDRWGHPVASGAVAGVAAGAAGAATRVAIGTTVAVLPSGCTTIVVGGVGYSQCGSTWYQPYYSGTTVQYTIVSKPR
jgi:hypothetical protein